MIKAPFFTLSLFALFLSGCLFSPKGGYAPKQIQGASLAFKATRIADAINQEFLNRNATYEFFENETYKLYLSNKFHSEGIYSYRKKGHNTAILVISYADASDQELYYVVELDFTSKSAGSMKASDPTSSIDDMEGKFQISYSKK